MASDSLGTMTVGVTANVSDAERALNSLANMLEKFDRQQQTRARSASSGARGAGAGGGGYFSPMSEEFQAEIKRMEMVQKRTEATLRFRQIRQSEMAAMSGRGTEENMRAIGEAFKSGDIERLEGVLGRANRGIQQVGDSSARTRYAVLNLGYGVQDAVQVFGTSGLAGAVRASANNLQGLGILLDKTAGGMAGLKSALMSGEFIVMGVATAVLLAASAWEKYSKAQEEALAKASAEKFKRLNPEKAVEQAGREEILNRELARMEKLNEAEDRRKKAIDAVAAANARLNAANREEADLKAKIAKIQKDIAEYDRVQGFAPAGRQRVAGRDAAVQRRTADEEALFRRVQEAGGRDVLASDLADLKKKMDEFAKGGSSPEAILKEKDAAQRELDATTKRVAELQPDAIANAHKQVEAYERQIKAIDALIKKEQESTAPMRDQKRAYDEMQKAYESGVEKRKKVDEEFANAVAGRGNPFAQRRLREALEKKHGLTKEEKEAMGVLGTVGGMEDKAAFDQQYAKAQERADRYAGIMETLKKRLAAIFATYPQLDPNAIPLEQKQSDMEYRLAFLGKKRRETEQRMRIVNQPTGVAEFESSTAYEALARSRMQQSPSVDLLQTIAREEQKATAALEDIREKLDPGRRARIAILETLE